MKFVKFKGGLGNKLFWYAFLRGLKSLFDQEAEADFLYCKGASNDDDVRKPRILRSNVKLNIANNQELKGTLCFIYRDDPKTLL